MVEWGWMSMGEMSDWKGIGSSAGGALVVVVSGGSAGGGARAANAALCGGGWLRSMLMEEDGPVSKASWSSCARAAKPVPPPGWGGEMILPRTPPGPGPRRRLRARRRRRRKKMRARRAMRTARPPMVPPTMAPVR